MKELIVLLGHGKFANSIPEAVATLMVRNYPKLVKWTGKEQEAIVIFIPEYYLSKASSFFACCYAKGQIISRWFFGVFDILQKTNKNKST